MAKFAINNFQCIERAVIEVEGLTVLHGDSSAGKSSIIKAIYAAINNRFRPTQLRHGSESILIAIQWEPNGPTLRVLRKLTGSPLMEMKYGKDVVRFDKLNRSVPKEVEEYNRMGNLQVDNDIFSLNFFSQFQKPLLLEFSQKKVMQLMSTSVAYDDYNAAKKQLDVNRERNKGSFQSLSSLKAEYSVTVENLNKEIEVQEPVVHELKNHYDVYQSVKSRIARLQSIKNLKKDLEFKQHFINSIDGIVNQCQETLHHLNTVNTIQLLLDGVNKVTEVNNKIKFVSKKTEALHSVNKSLELRNKLQELSNSVRDLSNANDMISKYDIMIDCRKSVQHAFEKVEQERLRCQRLRELQRSKSSIATIKSRIIIIDDIINEHRCPLCGSKL